MSERFFVVQQLRPIHFILKIENGQPPFVAPLIFEVIDRGESFKVWGTSEDKLLARFATINEADQLLKLLG